MFCNTHWLFQKWNGGVISEVEKAIWNSAEIDLLIDTRPRNFFNGSYRWSDLKQKKKWEKENESKLTINNINCWQHSLDKSTLKATEGVE